MKALDPTTVRLSDSFLLSDFMGCDSVYRYGHPNRIYEDDTGRLEEGAMLAQSIDQIQATLGPVSVSYGYISPMLSRKVVKYQSPDKPSYHRWDAGAAADICIHEHTEAPIYAAFEIDEWLHYSRMITYSESNQICIATRVSEQDGKRRGAFYENRYIGNRKPMHVKYPDNPQRRKHAKDNLHLMYDWKGQGFPSYHGGGFEQFHHIRVSDYLLLSDLLYKATYVHKGIKNLPPLTDKIRMRNFQDQAQRIGVTLDMLVSTFQSRFSIVKAYERRGKTSSNWTEEGVSFVIVPPIHADVDLVVSLIESEGQFEVTKVRQVKKDITRIICYEC